MTFIDDDFNNAIVLTKKLNPKEINELADLVIAIGDAEYIYKFARDVLNAPIDKLADAVIATGGYKYFSEFIYFINLTNQLSPNEIIQLFNLFNVTQKTQKEKYFSASAEKSENDTIVTNEEDFNKFMYQYYIFLYNKGISIEKIAEEQKKLYEEFFSIKLDDSMKLSSKDLREEESTLEDKENIKRNYISLRG